MAVEVEVKANPQCLSSLTLLEASAALINSAGAPIMQYRSWDYYNIRLGRTTRIAENRLETKNRIAYTAHCMLSTIQTSAGR
eukprot:scaffold10467_cov56-Attheya_sp.AAC.1